jgi:mRNA-degrading endonuclease RelE of RelBE toxin-antitoxin system
MIRIIIAARLRKTLDKQPEAVRLKSEKALVEVTKIFGDPHRHQGLGIRKLAKRSYEIRVHLQWRIVLIHDGDSLVAFDLMNHDEITAWLRGR